MWRKMMANLTTSSACRITWVTIQDTCWHTMWTIPWYGITTIPWLQIQVRLMRWTPRSMMRWHQERATTPKDLPTRWKVIRMVSLASRITHLVVLSTVAQRPPMMQMFIVIFLKRARHFRLRWSRHGWSLKNILWRMRMVRRFRVSPLEHLFISRNTLLPSGMQSPVLAQQKWPRYVPVSWNSHLPTTSGLARSCHRQILLKLRPR